MLYDSGIMEANNVLNTLSQALSLIQLKYIYIAIDERSSWVGLLHIHHRLSFYLIISKKTKKQKRKKKHEIKKINERTQFNSMCCLFPNDITTADVLVQDLLERKTLLWFLTIHLSVCSLDSTERCYWFPHDDSISIEDKPN